MVTVATLSLFMYKTGSRKPAQIARFHDIDDIDVNSARNCNNTCRWCKMKSEYPPWR